MSRLWRWSRLAIGAVLLVLGTLIVGGGFDARRRHPDLEPWHRARLEDVTAAVLDRGYTFQQYAAHEERLFGEVRALEASLDAAEHTPINRYFAGSRSHPSKADRDWNRSFETEAIAPVRGGALLLHGLTDSPYSMRAIAAVLRDAGIYSLSLRLPGHGTVPSGLVRAAWEDWLAAVRVGVRHVRGRIPGDAPLILVGYSNGGALALKYTLDAVDNGDAKPAKLILVSPMIGVTPAARLARWIGMLGGVPYFEKANWIDVLPEYNPFKYNSFAANAGLQTARLTGAIHAGLARIVDSGRASALPAILTFQSIVDATVSAPAVVHSLYERLPANGSELVLFDVNHLAGVDVFVQPADLAIGERFVSAAARPYRRVIVTNASAETREVEARVLEAGQSAVSRMALGLSWPADVFSMTHVAVPFRVDDPLYGIEAPPAATGLVALGRLAPRGEKGVLILGTDALMRLTSNPFFPFVAERINGWLASK